MGEKDLIVFIVLINIVLFVFIFGLIFFFFQFRKRKLLHNKEMQNVKAEYENAMLKVEIDSQKETMRSLGKEIHDGVGQKLTLASIYGKQALNNQENQNNLKEVIELIDESLSDLRSLSRTLVNSEKYKTKLSDLIQLEVKRVNDTNKVIVELCSNEDIELNEKTKNNLHKIILEFVQNSIKYAECTIIKINLNYQEENLYILCEDNGLGFNTEKAKGLGLGLRNIEERVSEINGEMSMVSEKNIGTKLYVAVPI